MREDNNQGRPGRSEPFENFNLQLQQQPDHHDTEACLDLNES